MKTYRQGAVFESGKLTPYVANLIFAVGVFVSTCVIMPILMRFPIVGEPVDKGHYWRGSLANHFWGWVGGGIWAIGMTFNVLAAGLRPCGRVRARSRRNAHVRHLGALHLARVQRLA